MTARRPTRAGFTLMELVVALAITGIAVSAGYAVLATLVDRRDALLEAVAMHERSAAARDQLIEWLRSARLDPDRMGASFRGDDGTRGGGSDDMLAFLTGAVTPLGSARTHITLRVARDSAGRSKGLVAELRDWDGTARRTVVLAPDVDALSLRYRPGFATEEPWLPSWITASVLPAAVELRFDAAPGDTLPPLLRRPILVPVEAGR